MSLFSDVFSIPAHFELFETLLFTFCLVCLLVKETSEIETGMAEKSSWDQAIIRQKLGLVWRNRQKIRQIIKDYFYLPFFLLIILWCWTINPSRPYVHQSLLWDTAFIGGLVCTVWRGWIVPLPYPPPPPISKLTPTVIQPRRFPFGLRRDVLCLVFVSKNLEQSVVSLI